VATKSIATLRAEANEAGEHQLKRALTPLNLITLGIGAIIGAGIFVLTGQAAALHAGPAVPISMALVGIACALRGLCYAEMASAVPVAGSAYTYSYATMGEFRRLDHRVDLVLEYAAGAATVGVGWSGHFVSLLSNFGITIPRISPHHRRNGAPPFRCTSRSRGARTPVSTSPARGSISLPSSIVVLMSTILVIGIKDRRASIT